MESNHLPLPWQRSEVDILFSISNNPFGQWATNP